MATEIKFTLAEVELMVKEAGQFAYEQGKLETVMKIADFIDSLAMHPTRKPSLDLVAERVRCFNA
jgi:hypothetical protein